MFRLVVLFLSLGIAVPAFADAKPAAKKGIEGYWLGTLKLGAIELRIGFDIKKKEDGSLKATLDSIDQGARDIPIESIAFADDKLTLKMPAMKAGYTGKLQEDGDTIRGEFEQSFKMALELKRQDQRIRLNRPQHPKEPFPYSSDKITFPSQAKDVKLAGTFTKPKGDGPFPTVVLISGSGPQDRDESLMGHRPFLVLADHLTRNGFAVLRFDDRGVGESTGSHAQATSRDFADDVMGAVAYLKDRKDIGKVGLIGHSEGGLIAPMVAATCSDIAFIVLLSGPGLPGDQVLVAQGGLIAEAMGMSADDQGHLRAAQRKLISMVKDGADEAKLKETFKEFEKTLSSKGKEGLEGQEAIVSGMLSSPWFRFFLSYDPRPTLAKVRCPVLAINGEKDLQVIAKENLPAIAKAVKSGGNMDVTTMELRGLNHLFQSSRTGLPSEYGKIEETFAPSALTAISEWLLKRK